jgi:hypothetical protein
MGDTVEESVVRRTLVSIGSRTGRPRGNEAPGTDMFRDQGYGLTTKQGWERDRHTVGIGSMLLRELFV